MRHCCVTLSSKQQGQRAEPEALVGASSTSAAHKHDGDDDDEDEGPGAGKHVDPWQAADDNDDEEGHDDVRVSLSFMAWAQIKTRFI